jgi:two-component system, cell cycle response regulator
LAFAETELRLAHQRLLAENQDLLENQSLHRRCLEILATVELEGLQDILLRTFSEITDSPGAALWVRNRRGSLVLRSYRGPIDRERLQLQIDPRNGPLAARIESGLPFIAPAAFTGEGPEVPGLYVPLGASGQTIGLCLVTDRSGPHGGGDVGRARVVGEFAALALRNARRLHDLERAGLRDRETQAYNLSYFIDYAGKELYKASRYGRQFSIITLAIDNLSLLRRRLPTGLLAETNRRLVKALSSLVRDSDVLSKVGEGEFYFLLPETDRFGAMMFERRVVAAARSLDEDSTEERPPLSIAVGSATYPRDGDDFDELLHLCRQRMDEARHTLRRKLHLEELGFWESVEALLQPSEVNGKAAETRTPDGLPSYLGLLPETHFANVQREVGRELSRDPRARGLLYIGAGELTDDPPILLTLPPGEIATRVYFLGRRGIEPLGHPAVTTVFAKSGGSDVERALQRHEFVLFLAERAAYAFMQRRGSEAACFHTSDRPLVDHLVAKLQEDYDLQPY